MTGEIPDIAAPPSAVSNLYIPHCYCQEWATRFLLQQGAMSCIICIVFTESFSTKKNFM